jgi:hypothetical protein
MHILLIMGVATVNTVSKKIAQKNTLCQKISVHIILHKRTHSIVWLIRNMVICKIGPLFKFFIKLVHFYCKIGLISSQSGPILQ